jgi:hypothetical protein
LFRGVHLLWRRLRRLHAHYFPELLSKGKFRIFTATTLKTPKACSRDSFRALTMKQPGGIFLAVLTGGGTSGSNRSSWEENNETLVQH